MRKIVLLILIILQSFNFFFAQKVFQNKEYGFQIQEPANWIEAGNKELLKNLEKFDVTENNLTKLLSDNKGSILLTSFYKYNPKTHSGVIPTIQINVRTKGNINFEQFKNAMKKSSESFKTYFDDFKFIRNASEIEISGITSIYFVGSFSMKTQDGQVLKVRSRTYAIPYKNYFFQINFTDGQNGEDCTAEFDGLVNTIKVGNKN